MKRKFITHPTLIAASTNTSLLDEFMQYHEDEDNYHNNEAGFAEMYEILNRYGTENESVDEVFPRATPGDQRTMVDLIRPKITSYDRDVSAILTHLENLVNRGVMREDTCRKIADMLPDWL